MPSAVFGVAPILRFSEATTRVPVTLVGVMHYNPHSINLVRTTIVDESRSVLCALSFVETLECHGGVKMAG